MVDGFEVLGPTFVKLGQLIASSPSLFPKPMVDACASVLTSFYPTTSRSTLFFWAISA